MIWPTQTKCTIKEQNYPSKIFKDNIGRSSSLFDPETKVFQRPQEATNTSWTQKSSLIPLCLSSCTAFSASWQAGSSSKRVTAWLVGHWKRQRTVLFKGIFLFIHVNFPETNLHLHTHMHIHEYICPCIPQQYYVYIYLYVYRFIHVTHSWIWRLWGEFDFIYQSNNSSHV